MSAWRARVVEGAAPAAYDAGMTVAGHEVRRVPFPERELDSAYQAGFAEAEKRLAAAAEWSGEPYGRYLELAGGARFFPCPATSTVMIAVIACVTLVLLGLGMIAGGIAVLVQKGAGELLQTLVFAMLGAGMIAGAAFVVVAARRAARRKLREPYGLFIFPDAVVVRDRVKGCELYPRASITGIDRYKGFGGAGSSSQMGGEGTSCARLLWKNADGSQQQRLLFEWPNHDQLCSALLEWRG